MSFGVGLGDILKVCELAGRVYKNCRDCPGEYKTLTSETRSLTNLLDDIQDKFDKIPESKQQQLIEAYTPCIEVLEELDKILLHYNGLDTKSKRAWDRLKFDPSTLRNLRERLVASVAMLNTFYTSLIHDVQVLILEALERLEKDYRGGHREESISSIERLTSGAREDDDEDDDEAWRQIIRDLEDVGISQQQALGYRDVIVDWLVAAVNEGRLLEDRPEHEPYSSLSQDLRPVLPEINVGESSSGLDMPTIVTPMESSWSPPSRTPPPIPRPPIPQVHIGSTLSVASQAHSAVSLPNMPLDTDSDDSSLYAGPHRSAVTTPSARSNTFPIPRVPVPRSSGLLWATNTDGPDPTLFTSSSGSGTQTPSIPAPPLDNDLPPSYFEKGTSITIDLNWTAHQVVAAWARHDFVSAEKHLENQLAAVDRGQRCISGTQPDRRILKHLLGVCASFTGKFSKAKELFESVFNGAFLDFQNLDDGDIAAARWLGDICLHTQEHANAMLAYSVAYEGSVGRYGATSERARRVATEIILIDHWLFGFRRIEATLNLNLDPTSIFPSANVVEKNKLMMNVKKSAYELVKSTSTTPIPVICLGRPTFNLEPRPRYELRLSEGFLVGPLISLSTWPLPWDPLFHPTDAVQLDRYMNTVRVAGHQSRSLYDRQLPTNSLGDSKKLHFLTKRGSRWLISAVEQGLSEMGITYAHHCYEPAIVCCLNQQREGVAFSEGVEIRFCKLSFRDVYGIKVTDVKWATRRVAKPSVYGEIPPKFRSAADFREIIKGVLDRAEEEENSLPKPVPSIALGVSNGYQQAPHTSLYKPPMYG
ncbi:hypothetical protein COCCADRAFT_35082 [Bipolaris zeicola 26-R-13]|uniref:Fungal N-terminal domain-containing protein n=1 Tax=Cochliobolus carbonum (strain 26-R-13) TaxID=930089 RepID=W6YI69_COCC2|nr:uncharacterized protein COCCADRAFT_35082 [Bipolaris zeicola 26-R-13]EUC35349.1 hypothetical protein COCCADRAFT_35082 [Bipolaris zeicola 26-R-13]